MTLECVKVCYSRCVTYLWEPARGERGWEAASWSHLLSETWRVPCRRTSTTAPKTIQYH